MYQGEYRHHHHGSIFGPLVLIGIGILFLLRNRVPGFDAYRFLAHYWPALLIVWGVVRLVEHYTAPGVGGLSGGEVALLVVIIVFGLALTASLSLGHWTWHDNWQGGAPWQQDYRFETATQATLPRGLPVIVRADRASVQLIATPGGEIRASLSDSVRASSFKRAQSRFQAGAPAMNEQNGAWLVQPAGPDPSPRLRAELRLYLPATTPVTVVVQHGDIQAANWDAALALTTNDGAIRVARAHAVTIGGEPDSVTLHEATGPVTISGGGTLDLSDIHDRVRLEGPFGGDVSLMRLAAGFQLTAGQTQVDCASLPGSFDLSGGGLLAYAARNLTVETHGRDLAIRGFRGALRVSDRDGAVAASAAPGAVIGPVRIQVRGGDIALGWPRDRGFQLDALARNGAITGSWGVPIARQGGAVSAQGTVRGGGSSIFLRTRDGAISRIAALAAGATAPAAQ